MTNQPQTTPAHQLMMAVARLRRVLEAHTAAEIVAGMTPQIAARTMEDMRRSGQLMEKIGQCLDNHG